ncbi:hypothetical protein SNEBB_004867 [Seison nebaliae]|nr:hypothetical protein SNEBB_004867 [Seison nebaliae]
MPLISTNSFFLILLPSKKVHRSLTSSKNFALNQRKNFESVLIISNDIKKTEVSQNSIVFCTVKKKNGVVTALHSSYDQKADRKNKEIVE